ncbi:hypothetical protein [Rhizobium leguminosarum]|nr:hypothetical protein [Rhizobium leguminosarum]
MDILLDEAAAILADEGFEEGAVKAAEKRSGMMKGAMTISLRRL